MMDEIYRLQNYPFSIVPKGIVPKAIDVPDLGRGVLPVQRFGEFVREIREASTIISEARNLNALQSYEVDISRIGMTVQLEPGRDGSGNKVAPTEDTVAISTNTLQMKELITKIGIEDETLEDNIERNQFEQTIVSLLGQGVSYDLECYFLHSDTSLTSGRDLYRINDGWMKLAANKVTEADADPEAEDWPLNLFDAMIDAIPSRYRQKLPQMKFYVSYKILKDYRDYLKSRESSLGDQAITQGQNITYEGLPVQYVPAMDALADGKLRALFTVPTNLVYGFWRNIRVEPKRDAEMRRTDYIVSLRADCNYEDEEGAVSATITV